MSSTSASFSHRRLVRHRRNILRLRKTMLCLPKLRSTPSLLFYPQSLPPSSHTLTTDTAFNGNCTSDKHLEEERPEKETSIKTTREFRSEFNYYKQQPLLSTKELVEDGFNWRKYGQKNVKGSKNLRSYYKCTYPNCSRKKMIESSIDGEITTIIYTALHNHSKPLYSNKSSLSPSYHVYEPEISNALCGNAKTDSTLENTCISIVDEDLDLQKCEENDIDDEDEPDAKRWRSESEGEGSRRTVIEDRVTIQTRSDSDVLEDGYKWRKYGQKLVKGNPNPRSYYKCTYSGCPVRKHVERAYSDLRDVVTTYEGKHIHQVPIAGGGGSHSLN